MKKAFLPHIDMIDYYQFVTFRTFESVDDFVLKIRKKNITNQKKEFEIDTYIDTSCKGAYLNGDILDYLKNYFLAKNHIFYELVCFCVMPNHIHILFKQKENISKIMHFIKGATAHKINKMLNKKGKFWEDNYYDRIIRNEKHFAIVYKYIKNNSLKAELKDFEDRFCSVYE